MASHGRSFHVQTQHDLFFIDWEQPRGVSKDDANDEQLPPAGRGGAPRADKNMVPVSVWRTIFVANEWVKLQEAQSISTEITLISLLFLLRGLGIEDYARLVPQGPGTPRKPHPTTT